MKIIILVLFVLISMNNAIAQSNQAKVNKTVRKIQKNELKSDRFKDIFHSYQQQGFLKLPANYDKNHIEYLRKNNLTRIRPYAYFYLNNGQFPFCVNVKKKQETERQRNDYSLV